MNMQISSRCSEKSSKLLSKLIKSRASLISSHGHIIAFRHWCNWIESTTIDKNRGNRCSCWTPEAKRRHSNRETLEIKQWPAAFSNSHLHVYISLTLVSLATCASKAVSCICASLSAGVLMSSLAWVVVKCCLSCPKWTFLSPSFILQSATTRTRVLLPSYRQKLQEAVFGLQIGWKLAGFLQSTHKQEGDFSCSPRRGFAFSRINMFHCQQQQLRPIARGKHTRVGL